VNESTYRFLSIDLLPLTAATMAALLCALLGNHLLLRRQSLMGDAISHAVLPGLVLAFLVTGTRDPLTMLAGAALSGLLTALLIEIVRRTGRVESSAATGVVFSIFFALGVALLERAAARQVDLDADCVLYGQVETLFWFPPVQWSEFFTLGTLSLVPRQVWTVLIALVVVALVLGLLHKELRLTGFDPAGARALGVSSTLLNHILSALTAIAVVAAFEAAGSILVIAMLVVPPAAARLVTDRLESQIALSTAFALVTGIGGYFLASHAPSLLGWPRAVSVAGTMALFGGAILVLVIVFAPPRGILARMIAAGRFRRRVATEDLLGWLFRHEEHGGSFPVSFEALNSDHRIAVAGAVRDGAVMHSARGITWTPSGRERASEIVRRHRLWESYLVSHVGVRPDHVHPTAERLEHLADAPVGHAIDPHGRPVPPARSS